MGRAFAKSRCSLPVLLALCLLASAGLSNAQQAWQKPGSLVGEATTGPDGGAMVWVAPREFVMGTPQGGDAAPEPAVEIPLGFWLGKCEVTNEQYAAFLNEVGTHEDGESGYRLIDIDSVYSDIELRDGEYRPKHGRESYPVMMVSWFGAEAYAQHYDMRLPTEAEWVYAASGPEGRKFPWGDAAQQAWCCNDRNRGPGLVGTLPVGCFPYGASWCWALDLAGNVAEWCADRYAKAAEGPLPGRPDALTPHDDKAVRGGSWDPYNWASHCQTTYGLALAPRNCLPTVGFRVALTPGDE